MSTTNTTSSYVAQLISELDDANNKLTEARERLTAARHDETNWINAVNDIKKQLAEAIEPLKLEDR